MHFYLEGYAEVLHLVTTARTLPAVVSAPSASKIPPPSPGILRRLWRASAKRIAGRLSRRTSSANELQPQHGSITPEHAR